MSAKGTAIVHASTYVIRGRIANLSRAGLCVRTRTTAPERLIGSTARVELRLDGPQATWLDCEARVLRIGANSLALGLHDVPAAFTRVIDEIVAASNRKDRLLSIVLVDGAESRRRAMAEAFRAAGCVVVEVAMPLEAVVRLGELDFEPDLIAIADSSPGTVANELRRFVNDEHARAKLVTIGEAADAPDALVNWLSANDPDGDLAARIRRLLTSTGDS